MAVQDVKYSDLKVGDTGSMTKTISEFDVYGFAGISGDFNPVHIDKEFAATTMFKNRIAHGLIAASFISAVLGTTLPGKNTIYMKQELNFLAPVYIGDTVTATVEVIEKIEAKNRAVLRTCVTNQDGEIVVDGQATIMKK